MIKGLGVLSLVTLLVVATIGLAGGGPWWFRYVGSGTLFFLLMLILTQLSNLPDKDEYRRMTLGGAGGEEIYSSEPIGGEPGEMDQEESLGRN